MGPKCKKLQGIKSHVLSLCSHGAKTISAGSPILSWSPAEGGELESRRHHGWKELQLLITGNDLLTQWLWKGAVCLSLPAWVLWAMPGDGGFGD